jgi:hypothetical protein
MIKGPQMALCDGLLAGGLLGLSPVKLPRGSSSESEASHWTPTLELRRAVEQHPINEAQPVLGEGRGDAVPVAHALQLLESAHDTMELMHMTDGLLAVPPGGDRAAAAQSLEAIATLACAQAFQLEARQAVDSWLAGACSDMPTAEAERLRELAARLQVGAHGAAAVDMTPQGGGAMQHRHAVVSFHHALHSPDFRGADGVTSPTWVTAELRCTADFKSTCQPQLVETLRIGIDVEWQAQPLGPPGGRHPTVGAKSMPAFLVSQAGGEAPRCQDPDADQLRRLQALLGLGRLPPRTFLSFLLLVTLGPGDRGGGSRAARVAGGAKRRRVSAEQPAAVPTTVQRAIALADARLSEVAADS